MALREAKEQMVPYSIVKDLIDMQNKYNEAMLEKLGAHLTECARLFELALNPPVQPIETEAVSPWLETAPRMSEEEEDLRYAYAVGDITKEELDQRLASYLDGSYTE